MASAETGKIGLISLHNLSRFKPSSYGALQDRGQQPLSFPFKTLTEDLAVTSCTTQLLQGVIHPFSAWGGLNLQLCFTEKCHYHQILKQNEDDSGPLVDPSPLCMQQPHSQSKQKMPEHTPTKCGWRMNFWTLLQESSLFLLSVQYIKSLQDTIQICSSLARNLNNSTLSCFLFQLCTCEVQCSPAPLGHIRTVLLSPKRVHLHCTPLTDTVQKLINNNNSRLTQYPNTELEIRVNKVRIGLLREENNLVLLNGVKLLPAPPSKAFTVFSEYLIIFLDF